ncbi:DUF4232 domain-containing protein [Streptomyces sp. OE57]|uniref:DUF4232 domain-containing protein n=1 Tax=Streptomyces lacaronensis TaxID=3379885 RepID=UPI0039B77EBB
MRTSRIRTVTLAAVTAAPALGLIACGDADGDSKAAGGDVAAGAAQSRSASDGDDKGGSEQANSGGDTKEGARSATGSGGSDEVARKDATADVQQCRGDGIRVTAVHRFAGQQGDHLLITASNAGAEPCWVTSYPAVKLGDDDSVLPHSKKDNPGGAVTHPRATASPWPETFIRRRVATPGWRRGDVSASAVPQGHRCGWLAVGASALADQDHKER